MEEKITLDRETFKALASDTRVSILKSLHKRRKTLTELSKQFEMSPSTIKEHLDSLSNAGLVVQKDEGHKWKYYELTSKGKNIVTPSETKVLVVLAVSVVGVFVTVFDLLRNLQTQIFVSRELGEAGSKIIPATASEATPDIAAPAVPQAGPIISQTPPVFPYLHALILAILIIALAASIFVLLTSRRRKELFNIKI